MTGQELLDKLLEIKEDFGTLDVEITMYHNDDRREITGIDLFTNREIGDKNKLHSIDINTI
jgi:hypothetical protein